LGGERVGASIPEKAAASLAIGVEVEAGIRF
jgi:hypothetical protein